MMESMSHDPENEHARLREELVAYLDGELDAEQSRRIEQRVAVEPDARHMLQELDRTWHMLDELDSPVTSEEFTRTTLEMVALAAVKDAEQARAEAPQRRRRAGLWSITGLVSAAAAGFLIVTSFLPDPNAPLLRDLPILENFEHYREIESVDFLRALSDADLFTKDTEDGR
jgi:anti-sigma factor RsiW